MPMCSPIGRLLVPVLTVLLAASVIACGGDGVSQTVDEQTELVPTAAEAEDAINQALQALNHYCVSPGAFRGDVSFPLSVVNPNSDQPSFQNRELMVLTEAGLLDTTLVEEDSSVPIQKFSLTPNGEKAFSRIVRGRRTSPMFCYAFPRVARLDSVKAVPSRAPGRQAEVWFGYHYRETADWIETPAVERIFSGLPSPPPPEDTMQAKERLTRFKGRWMDQRLTGNEDYLASP